MDDFCFAIKNENGFYYCGLKKWDKQIRKAKIYTSIKYAQEAGLDCLSRRRIINLDTDGFKVVEVELKEKEDI